MPIKQNTPDNGGILPDAKDTYVSFASINYAKGEIVRLIYSMSDILTEFDETTWNALAESATVHKNGKIAFLFRDGSKRR